MTTALPFRSRVSNNQRATAAPAAFALVASRPAGPDAAVTLLRSTIEGTFEAARRHAIVVADALASYHPEVTVELFDGAGVPVLMIGRGGAS